jgi:FlaG/FlaF family flagellin (archaellin)
MKKKTKQDESAVSPVIGVMLMLVVTIIIAAVVSAFSGGLIGTTQKAPNAVLNFQIQSAANEAGFYAPDMSITEVSGDTLPTRDLRITTIYTNSTGTTFQGSLTGEQYVTGNDSYTYFTSSEYGPVLYLNDMSRFGNYSTITSTPGTPDAFGNASAILRPGDTLTTVGNYCGNWGDGSTAGSPNENPGLNYLLGFNVTEQEQVGGFGQGSIVEVKVIHIPSQKIIADEKVTVE